MFVRLSNEVSVNPEQVAALMRVEDSKTTVYLTNNKTFTFNLSIDELTKRLSPQTTTVSLPSLPSLDPPQYTLWPSTQQMVRHEDAACHIAYD